MIEVEVERYDNCIGLKLIFGGDEPWREHLEEVFDFAKDFWEAVLHNEQQ